MFIQDKSGLRLSGGTLCDEMNLDPCYTAWITKGFYAFVFEDLSEVSLCDGIPEDAARTQLDAITGIH